MAPINRLWCYAATVLAATLICAASENAVSLAEFVKRQFVQELSIGLKDFRVCEAFSKGDDKGAFFRKTLDLDPFSSAQTFESREIFLEDGEGPKARKAHLGILVLQYPDVHIADQIQSALSKKGGYFRGTEVLTKFASFSTGEFVLVVYSESALNKKVLSFLNNIESEVKAKKERDK